MRFNRAVCVVALLATPMVGAGPTPSPLRAGASTSNITPSLGAEIVGGWKPLPSTRVHDELHARSLVLDDGRTRLAFVVVDNVSVDREVFDEAKRQIHAATGLPIGHMLMSSTHTHSATSARPASAAKRGPMNDYQEFLARRIADGVQRAIVNLAPARVAWGTTDVPQHVFNRRWFLKPGTPIPNPFGGQDKVLMNPPRGGDLLLKPAGPTDPQVVFLSVQRPDGRPVALLANYSLHYVGDVREGEISADYFAAFADRIQQLFGGDRQDPPFVGIMANGTSGNINNVDFTKKLPSTAPYTKINLVADDVAQAVFAAHKDLRWRDSAELAMIQRELTLKVRKPTPALMARARAILARPADAPASHVREVAYARRTLDMAQMPDELPVILQAIRIGDLAVTAIPFEVFVEIGLEIKRRSPFKPTFTISLANGGNAYLPTPEHHALGGYETWLGTNKVEVQASRKITEQLIEMLRALGHRGS